jgi:hypothetical protein
MSCIARLGTSPVIVVLAMLTAIVVWSVPSVADSGPQPPCGRETFPPYPNLDNPPVAKVWDRNELGRDWMPPIRTDWASSGFSTLVVTVARFRHTSGVEGLLRHVGAISELAGMRYWSTTHKRWQTLIVDAYSVAGPVGDRRRKDFSLDELAGGQRIYFQQEDSLSGKATYQMRIRSATPDRLVFDSENISTLTARVRTSIFRRGAIWANSAALWRKGKI